MTQPTNWPKEFDREQIRGWLEESTHEGVSVEDSFPDTLAATAESLGMLPIELKIWCYDTPKTWTAEALAIWARKLGFNRTELAAVERDAAILRREKL
jgi:hypothetical protein